MGRFVQVNCDVRAALRESLDFEARSVLYELVDLVDYRTARMSASVNSLARELGVGTRQGRQRLSAALDRLVAAGWVQTTFRRGAPGAIEVVGYPQLVRSLAAGRQTSSAEFGTGPPIGLAAGRQSHASIPIPTEDIEKTTTRPRDVIDVALDLAAEVAVVLSTTVVKNKGAYRAATRKRLANERGDVLREAVAADSSVTAEQLAVDVLEVDLALLTGVAGRSSGKVASKLAPELVSWRNSAIAQSSSGGSWEEFVQRLPDHPTDGVVELCAEVFGVTL